MIYTRASMAVVSLFVATLFCGCGGAPAGSTVKVTVTSSKIKLDDTDSLEVIFTPEGTGTPATAIGNAKDQPLTAARGEMSGVLPGKYQLGVRVTPYAGMAPPDRVQSIERLNEVLAGSAASRTYEVTADKEQSITIDLDSNTVTKS